MIMMLAEGWRGGDGGGGEGGGEEEIMMNFEFGLGWIWKKKMMPDFRHFSSATTLFSLVVFRWRFRVW
jgi:hypothetical protein